MAWKLEFARRAEKQLDRLDRQVATRTLDYMRNRVATGDPYKFAERLEDGRQEGARFRVGDYRIVADILPARLIVVVIKIGGRGQVYRRP